VPDSRPPLRTAYRGLRRRRVHNAGQAEIPEERSTRYELIALEKCDVLEKQARQPLGFAMRAARITPQSRHVIDEIRNSGALLRFECIGDQPVIWMHPQEPMLCDFRFMARMLDVLTRFEFARRLPNFELKEPRDVPFWAFLGGQSTFGPTITR
jgi:hypothetical protein